MFRKTLNVQSGAALALAIASSFASAGTIVYDHDVDVKAQGFGNQTNLLTLQEHPANITTETGSVAWSGSANVYTGDADTNIGKSSTFLVSSITSDLDRLGILFNLDDSGGASEFAFMDSLVAKFYNGTTGAVVATATFTNPGQQFPQAGGGVGGAGNPFHIVLSPAEKALVGAAGVRIGLAASISAVDNGPDTFTIAEFLPNNPPPPPPPPPPVPSPSTISGGLLLLGGLVIARRRRAANLA